MAKYNKRKLSEQVLLILFISRYVQLCPQTHKILAASRLQPLIRLRTREGMAIARAKGKLRGKQLKLSDKQQKELCRMHETGQYSISDLAELFSVSRPTVYRTLSRNHKE